LLQPPRDSSPPPRNPRCESCQTSRRNGHHEIREMADVAKGLIETSPLFGAHTPPPPPLAAGVAGGGARRSTNRLRIAGPAHERETLETGWECKMIEMNGMGMRGDRNERARFPKFEQSLLTSGHASEWTARALRPERSGRAGGSAAQVYGSAEMGGFVSACCNKVFAFKLNNLWSIIFCFKHTFWMIRFVIKYISNNYKIIIINNVMYDKLSVKNVI
jgi:hypothetical protein